MTATHEMIAPRAFSIAKVVELTGLARTTIYAAIRDRNLRARKCGRRTLILSADLQKFLASLPDSKTFDPPATDIHDGEN